MDTACTQKTHIFHRSLPFGASVNPLSLQFVKSVRFPSYSDPYFPVLGLKTGKYGLE